MKQPISLAPLRNQRGLSLIELMVSITIGLVIMIAVMSVYVGSSAATGVAAAQGRMNEDAQAAISILTQHIRMAGNNPKQANYTFPTDSNPAYDASIDPYAIRGCNNTFSNVTSAATLNALTCNTPGTPKPHSIAVRYEADIYNTLPSGGKPTDCLGNQLALVADSGAASAKVKQLDPDLTKLPPNNILAAAFPAFYVADNRFFLFQPTGATAPSLYCKGNGGSVAAQPLVENIEDMQFVYGTARAPTSSPCVFTDNIMAVKGYLDADKVETDTDISCMADLPAQWGRVMTVKLCLQVRSDRPVNNDSATNVYSKCFSKAGDPPTSSTDGYLRRTYYSTVVLRNRVPAD